jgi:large subunit ribosomal protein L21
MYAIVEIAGQQFKVEKDQKVFVHRLSAEEGSKVSFGNVLLWDNDGAVKVGTPTVSGVTVSATVLNHLKGDKVLVFKKKRRKGYQKMNGHRQFLTCIQIEGIGGENTENREEETPKVSAEEVSNEEVYEEVVNEVNNEENL